MAFVLRSSLTLPLVLALLVACGGSAVPPTVVPAVSRVVSSPVASPTPWPTFTPAPTPLLVVEASLLPGEPVSVVPTPVLYLPLQPTVLPGPEPRVFPANPAARSVSGEPMLPGVAPSLVPAVVGSDQGPPVSAEPGPVDSVPSEAVGGTAVPAAGAVSLYRGGAAFQRQTLFVMQDAELPDYLSEGHLDRLPPTKELIPNTAPFLFWFVGFDLSGADPDFEMDIRMRWVSLGPEGVDAEPVEMHSDARVLTHQEPFFYTGIKAPLGNVWPLGGYRLELVDDRGELIGSWEFFVI